MKNKVADPKIELYHTIKKALGDLIDGENKDGLFLTIDSKQYNIKITAKKSITWFEGMENISQDANGESEASRSLSEVLNQTKNKTILPEEVSEIKQLFAEDKIEIITTLEVNNG